MAREDHVVRTPERKERPGANLGRGEAIAKTVASVMKKRRRELNLTQADLARRAGISLESIRNYECSRRRMSLQAAIVVSEALEITTEELSKGM